MSRRKRLFWIAPLALLAIALFIFIGGEIEDENVGKDLHGHRAEFFVRRMIQIGVAIGFAIAR